MRWCRRKARHTPEELHSLERYLADYPTLPSAAQGIEACVQFTDCDPRALFAQWHAMSCTLAGEFRRGARSTAALAAHAIALDPTSRTVRSATTSRSRMKRGVS